MRYLSILIICLILGGCAATAVDNSVGVSTPEQMLRRASELLEEQVKPRAAEDLILEAMLMCEMSSDEICAARAYKGYAEFLQSPALGRWERLYRKQGFSNREILFSARFWHALDYWEKALATYKQVRRYDGMRSAHYNIGLLYDVQLGNKQKACDYYKKSYASHVIFRLDYPELPADVPAGYNSYEDYIRKVMQDKGCLELIE